VTTYGLYIEETLEDGYEVKTPTPLVSTATEIDEAVGVGTAWILDYGLCALLGEGPSQA
jgi:hypothetical protein